MPAPTSLPAAALAGAFAALNTPPDSDPRRTLLIVDDEDGPRQSLRVIFRDEYRLLLAASGEAALELIKAEPVDAAILDIRMDGMNGVELLGKLKRLDPKIEVIMLTAFETIDTIRQALRQGACDYLNKPFDIHQIRAAVANAMERRSLNLEIHANNLRLVSLQDELNRQRVEEEIMKATSDIYKTILHDINGPLTIISGFIQVINRKIGDTQQVEGESLDIVKDRLNRITRQVTLCIDISRRYLGFLRHGQVERMKVGVNQILADVGELLKVHPSVGHNQLNIHPLPEDATVAVNGTDLIQILLNLTINALQAVEAPHEVLVNGAFQRRPIDLDLMREGPHDRVINRDGFRNADQLLVLAVRDNGPGIPEDILTRLFESQFTTKPEGKGTGLGLTIVRRLVTEANGMLHLSSRRGAGTTFTIYLPAEPRV